jgi:enoyl-CoA hydratase
MAKKYNTLLIDIDADGIATLTIDRADKLNAINNEVMSDLEGAIMELRYNDLVKVIILTGSGEKAFVAGADIRELSYLNRFTATVLSERGQEIFALFEESHKPVIAYINGYALGGGFELALACHMRVAAPNAVFGLPEVSLGLIPGYGATQRLTHLIGKGRAMEFILTGNTFKVERAYELGVVNKIVSGENGLEETKAFAKVMLTRGPLALGKAIKVINASSDPEQGFKAESEAFGELFATKDFSEGTAAFLQKRPPSFNGN